MRAGGLPIAANEQRVPAAIGRRTIKVGRTHVLVVLVQILDEQRVAPEELLIVVLRDDHWHGLRRQEFP
jgi:hypothetical protein